jgi:hypothetical protein
VITPTQESYIFGGEDRSSFPYQYSDEIMWLAGISDDPADTGHSLLTISGKAWMPAVWWESNDPVYPSRAYLFWGKNENGVSDCITIYKPTVPNPLDCDVSTLNHRSYGASAVYDGSRYVYIFGGYRSVAPPGPSNWILRIDTQDPSFDPDEPGASIEVLPTTLPTAVFYSAAAWDPVRGVAFIVGGRTGWYDPGDRASIVEFDPATGTAVEVAQLPAYVDSKPGPMWKFSAVYDETVQRVLIFGGAHECADMPGSGCPDPSVWVWYHDSVIRFNPNPASYEVVVDECLSLPTDREGTSAVWRQSRGESLVFGGSTGALTTWNGYGEVVRYEA